MATVITRPVEPVELPGPSYFDERDLMGARLGVPFRIPFLKVFGVDTQFGTIWLGTWGVVSIMFFAAGFAVQLWGAIASVHGDMGLYVQRFANIQILPPDGLGMAPSMAGGGYWETNLLLWAISVTAWAGRCWERLMRFSWRPYLFFAWVSAILLTTTIWVFRPILMGTWAEAPGFGLNADLDWAQNFSVLWGNLYYNPWHMLAIFFLFGSTMLWGMHGATILATSAEGSHKEVAEIKDMHSGSHKSMLFWRWTMGFNANPKTIHDWIWWWSVGTVLSSAIGIISTGWITNDWYAWSVDHGIVEQYGPMTRDFINLRPNEVKLELPVSMPRPMGTP